MAATGDRRRTRAARTDAAGAVALSKREAEVLGLVAQGLTNAQIAAALRLSPHTVARHIVNVRSKLGATNRVQAAVIFSLRQATTGAARPRQEARRPRAARRPPDREG